MLNIDVRCDREDCECWFNGHCTCENGIDINEDCECVTYVSVDEDNISY